MKPSPKRIANPVVARKPQESTIITEVAVRSVYPSRLKYIGTVSGKSYEWSDAGAVVTVLSEDVPTLLEKRIGSKSCCGALNLNGNQVFELA
jgi:hypothetical protein